MPNANHNLWALTGAANANCFLPVCVFVCLSILLHLDSRVRTEHHHLLITKPTCMRWTRKIMLGYWCKWMHLEYHFWPTECLRLATQTFGDTKSIRQHYANTWTGVGGRVVARTDSCIWRLTGSSWDRLLWPGMRKHFNVGCMLETFLSWHGWESLRGERCGLAKLCVR